MEKTLFICCLVVLFATPVFSQEKDIPRIDGPVLSDSLKIMEPLANKNWIGEIKHLRDGRLLKINRNFQVIWNGSIVKYSSYLPEMNSFIEGYYYWDWKAKQVEVFIITNRGVLQKGAVSVENGMLTVKGTISFPERSFEYKNTFEFTADGKMIDRWSQTCLYGR